LISFTRVTGIMNQAQSGEVGIQPEKIQTM